MSPSRPSRCKAAPRAEQRQRRFPRSRLDPSTPCDRAFRILAWRFLGHLTANQAATCAGDPKALHQMRMALTRLRTAISFFSPMAADPKRANIKCELKWLNTHLGAARDLDVAIERLKANNKQRLQALQYHRSLENKRAKSHRHLTAALRSARYRRLIDDAYRWTENGAWSTKKGKQARARTSPIAAYSARKLMRWQEKLLKKSRKLRDMGTKRRHRLRLANKKLFYSTEFFGELFSDQFSRQQAALKHLRQAQKSLGQLNDDANGRSLVAALKRDGVRTALLGFQFLRPEHKKRLIRKATKTYRRLETLKPLWA
jgi:CHAD domain-containing protein